MLCYSCSEFPGSVRVPCPGSSPRSLEGVTACTVRSLPDGTVVHQGGTDLATGCSQEKMDYYNQRINQAFRRGAGKSACCSWDNCNKVGRKV